MSENERTPGRLDLSRICKMPTGKAGKAAKKQFEKERKARMEKIRQLTYASGGDGLLVMLTAADRKVCHYIMKKLDHVIPFFVRACADGRCLSVTQEMGWLLDRCSKQGYRTMWIDLAGTEKLDKKQILYLVAGELIRVLERPAPEVVPMEEVKEAAEAAEAAEPEAVPVEEAAEAAEPEAVPVEEAEEAAEPEAVPVEEVEEAAGPEAVPVEEAEEAAGPEAVPVEEVEEAAGPEAVPVEEATEPEKPEEPEKPAPARRRTRKAAAKTEEAAPAKPRRKRQARAPLTVEETLAKRRRQLGLEE